MTTTAIRQRLITYFADADESKVKAVYTLLQKDIEEERAFALTEEQIDILNTERKNHLSGVSKSYSRDEALAMIRGNKS